MDGMEYEKGERVTWSDPDGFPHDGVVESYRRGWVMIDLDMPHQTEQGWSASKMMVRSSELGQ